MKRLIVLLLMIIPLYGSAQEVWTEGTEWVVTYADGDVHTFTLSGTATFDGTEYIKLLDNQQEEPIGYIRSEHGDTLVYARGVINGKLTEEFLLYDFGSFEPGTSLVYTCYNYETQTPVCFSREIDADSISYYNNVIEEGDIIPCCYGVIFKLGWDMSADRWRCFMMDLSWGIWIIRGIVQISEMSATWCFTRKDAKRRFIFLSAFVSQCAAI